MGATPLTIKRRRLIVFTAAPRPRPAPRHPHAVRGGRVELNCLCGLFHKLIIQRFAINLKVALLKATAAALGFYFLIQLFVHLCGCRPRRVIRSHLGRCSRINDAKAINGDYTAILGVRRNYNIENVVIMIG